MLQHLTFYNEKGDFRTGVVTLRAHLTLSEMMLLKGFQMGSPKKLSGTYFYTSIIG